MKETLVKRMVVVAVCLFFMTDLSSANPIEIQGPGLDKNQFDFTEYFKTIAHIGTEEQSLAVERQDDGSITHVTPQPGQGGDIPKLLYRHIAANTSDRIIDRINNLTKRNYGTNSAILLNGYFVTLFAPDSGGGPGGFLVYDISNPRSIELVTKVFDPDGTTSDFREAHAFGVSIQDSKRFVSIHTGKGIEIWDFTDVYKIHRVSKLALPHVDFGDYSQVAWQLAWQAPYLYVAGANNGLYIVDTSDIRNPKLFDLGSRSNPIPVSKLGGFRIGPLFAAGNELFISSMDNTDGLARLDISDPLNPIIVNKIETLPKYYAICYDGKRIFATVRGPEAQLYVYNIENDSVKTN